MESSKGGESFELQLGGVHAAAVAVTVIALCTATFFLGRWWERTRGPGAAGPGAVEVVQEAAGEDPDAPVSGEEVGERLTFYENLPRNGAVDAPGRAAAAGPSGAGFVIQVLATQEESAAANLAERLRSKGFPAFVQDSTDGAARRFFRVGVGPFRQRPEAERTAARLEKEERLSTWIRSVE